MDLSQFCDHLDRYGGDLAAWPADLQGDARSLLATSADARSALNATMEFEAFLREPLRPSALSTDALATRATAHRQSRMVPVGVRRAAWATAAAAALILGVFIGDAGPQREEVPDHVMAAAFDSMGTFDVD